MLKRTISFDGKCILITGVAGFIGAHLTKELLQRHEKMKIIGIDNMNGYYDIGLKEYRLREICSVETESGFEFVKGDISDRNFVTEIFDRYEPQIVIHLAAQAGVRYSLEQPESYIQSNIVGFWNMLEACRKKAEEGKHPEHFLYAGSSSVYGNNKKVPYSEEDKTDCPVSLYAATKKSSELLAYSYARLFGIASTGLRFFTVYGPCGRPDMAYYSFTNKLKNNGTIQIYNYGRCKRDFTYIDDIISGILAAAQVRPVPDENGVRYKIYNLGNNRPENLMDFVKILQRELVQAGILPKDFDFESHMEYVPMQPGDVEMTYADISAAENDLGFRPQTSLEEGICKFAEWYAAYYGEKREGDNDEI